MDAVVFDMDGVLVNSVSHKFDQWDRNLRAELGVDTVDTAELVGLNARDKYEFLVREYDVDAARSAVVECLTCDDETVYRERVDLLPGVESTLEWLRSRETKTGLVSAAGRAQVDRVVTRFELEDRLDTVLSADDIDEASKPDPALYLHAAGQLGTDPAACLAVEDSPHGVTAAVDAGAYCIGYKPPNSPDRDVSHADEVVRSPDALHGRIRALVGTGATTRQ